MTVGWRAGGVDFRNGRRAHDTVMQSRMETFCLLVSSFAFHRKVFSSLSGFIESIRARLSFFRAKS